MLSKLVAKFPLITRWRVPSGKKFKDYFESDRYWKTEDDKLIGDLKIKNRDIDLLELTDKLNSNRLEIVKGITDTQKLKEYQKTFFDDVSEPKAAYLYLRVTDLLIHYLSLPQELNRQGDFAKVVQLFEKYRSRIYYHSLSPSYWEKIMDQYKLSKREINRLNPPARPQNYWLLRLRNVAIFLALLNYLTSEVEKAENGNGGSLSELLGFSKKNDQIEEEKNVSTRFSDVLGIDEFKEELLELVDYLKDPKKYTEVGAKIPKGILLSGPPGTGKTLLARALAGEAGCNFYYKSGSEFDEVYVGVGASRVRDLFKKARANAPSIIFIDEIDSVAGKRRSTDPSTSRDTVNQILAEMDGFKQGEGVIVIGATNFEQALDSAIKRPGRFDKVINVPLPDIKGREEIFNFYLKKIKVDKTVECNTLARQSTGYTGADIQNVVNIAILNAIKEGRQEALKEDFEFAHDRVAMGIGRKKMFVSDKVKLITAYHEGGHALASLLTEGAMPLHKVTILPRGGSLGHTAMLPEEDDDLKMTRRSMLASIDVAMGGRAAEELTFGEKELTAGCGSDLANATKMAYEYVRGLGMVEGGTFIVADKDITSDRHNYLVDKEVQKILSESNDRVKTLLKRHEGILTILAQELLKKETISADEVRTLLKLTRS